MIMTTNSLPKITIYTDGGCNPNPGPGGWAAILLRPDTATPQEMCGAVEETTNQRMEMQAAINALASLEQPHRVTLYTDSSYLRNGITAWLPKWEARNWLNSHDEAVKNKDLWLLLAAEQRRHDINWQWVKGHAGDKWNERADELASSQIPRPKLPLDDEAAIHLFTAAAFAGKHKQGGWAVVMRYQEHQKMLSGCVADTSSNRMHLQAALEGLRAVKRGGPLHVYTTSDYLKDGVTQWFKGWVARQWQTKDGKSVKHRDLWEALVEFKQRYPIEWHVVPKSEMPPEMVEAKQMASAEAKK